MEELKPKYRCYILDFDIKWAHLQRGIEPRYKLIDWHVIPKTSLYGALYFCSKKFQCEFIGKSQDKDGLPKFVHPFVKNDYIIGISNVSWGQGFYFCAISNLEKSYKSKIKDFMLFGSPEVLNIKRDFGKTHQNLFEDIIEFAKKNSLYSVGLKDYEKWGPLSYLIKGFRLLEIGEVVAEQDYFWDNGHWLSVTFRESHSPIKPGDVIAEKTEKINRLFVIRKE